MHTFLLAIAAVSTLVLVPAANAQDYPSRTVTVIVPFPAGGGADLFARLIGQELSSILGKPFIIENRPGAGGNIGAGAVARAAPDGSTLLYTTSALAIAPAVYSKLQFRPRQDLQPINITLVIPQVLVVHPSLPVADLRQFIALAKAKPGAIAYGADIGSAGHLAMEMLARTSGIACHHIPYKGVAPIVTALIGGEVQSAFLVIPLVRPYLANKRIRAIGMSSARRSPVLPDIETIQEQGIAGFEALQWHAFFAPAGTPARLLERLNAAIQEALHTHQVMARAAAEDSEVARTAPAEFAAFFEREIDRYSDIARIAGIKAQ